MAETAGATLADGSLRFFSTLGSAVAGLKDVDLILASGVLLYTPDPMSCLKQILSIKAQHIFITRTVLSESNWEGIGIQRSRLAHHGPGPMPPGFDDQDTVFPISIVQREKFELEAKRTYDIRFRTEEDKKTYRHDGETFGMFGNFLDLNP